MIITKILGVKIKIDTDYNPFESFLLNNFTNEKSSNTDVTTELTSMIKAQQLFSGASRLLQAEVEMVRSLFG